MLVACRAPASGQFCENLSLLSCSALGQLVAFSGLFGPFGTSIELGGGTQGLRVGGQRGASSTRGEEERRQSERNKNRLTASVCLCARKAMLERPTLSSENTKAALKLAANKCAT